MAITSRNALTYARKIDSSLTHPSFVSVGASYIASLLTSPGSNQGTNQGTNATSGVIPTKDTAGAISLPATKDSEKLYLVGVQHPECSTTYYGDTYVFDMLWICGGFSAVGTYNFTGQPDISGRLPVIGGNPQYDDVLPMLLAYGTTSGTQTVDYTYTDENDVSQTPATYSAGPSFNGRVHFLPMASKGIKKINSFTLAGGTTWAWSLVLARLVMISSNPWLASGQFADSANNTGIMEVHKESMLWHCCRGGSNTIRGGWIFKFVAG